MSQHSAKLHLEAFSSFCLSSPCKKQCRRPKPMAKGHRLTPCPVAAFLAGDATLPRELGRRVESLGNQTVQNQSTLRDRRRHRHKGSEPCIPAAEGCCRQRCPACVAGLQQHLSLPTWPPPSSSAGLRSFPWLWAALQPRRTPGSPPAALPRQHRPGSSAQRGRAAPALYVHLVRLCKL